MKIKADQINENYTNEIIKSVKKIHCFRAVREKRIMSHKFINNLPTSFLPRESIFEIFF